MESQKYITYRRDECAVFLKTTERFGGLSNMAGGYPLSINGIRVLTSEALYQACRFPHLPDVQKLIIGQASPMTAKMKSKQYRKDSRSDWDSVRVSIMRWCLLVKLVQHWEKFGNLLLSTGDRPIVEGSYRDPFWGAKPVDQETLQGANILGRLLIELREKLRDPEAHKLWTVEPPSLPQFLLLNRQISVIERLKPEFRPVLVPESLELISSEQLMPEADITVDVKANTKDSNQTNLQVLSNQTDIMNSPAVLPLIATKEQQLCQLSLNSLSDQHVTQKEGISMPDLLIPPEAIETDIVASEHVEEYKNGMAFLYRELKNLHVNIYLIEKILQFPLKLFTDDIPDRAIFLSYFLDNAIDKCILIIANLIATRGRNSKDIYSLQTFQMRIAELVEPEYKHAFEERIQENELDAQASDIYQRIKRLRDKQIVHLTTDYYDECYDDTIAKTRLYIKEIKALCEKLYAWFHNLSFGCEYVMLYSCYWDDQPIGRKTDIEEILDSIARNSYILDMPEHDPDRWADLHPHLSQEDLDHLNQYRNKLGMPEVLSSLSNRTF